MFGAYWPAGLRIAALPNPGIHPPLYFAWEVRSAGTDGRELLSFKGQTQGRTMKWDRVQESWRRVSGTTKQALGQLARNSYGVLHARSLSPERERTDESLRTEREKTDQAVAVKQADVARHADAVVDRARDNADEVLSLARENADTVLEAAREKADEALDPDARGVQPKAAIVEERALADEALRDERDGADETLRLEREEYARTLVRFLPLERESTDRYLLTERIRSDNAVANRDDFLAMVAHDLRDLISGVVVSSALLSKRAPQGEDGDRILVETKRIERYAARMNRLIGDLVDVASIEAGKLAVTLETRDLATLISEAVDTFRATASAKGVSLRTQLDAAPLLAAFDHHRILQVLANLLSNSLKFTPRGGQVTIVGERAAGEVCLSVRDTGSGIPEDALERIFERFAQVGENDRRGLGLGLYLSRCIVEAHGGRIWAERQAQEGGSKVSFKLPTHSSAAPGVSLPG
jgi:signal transduction histidine kinase